jgi:hypothetical protein
LGPPGCASIRAELLVRPRGCPVREDTDGRKIRRTVAKADISDLKNELDHGRTIAKTASFLCRDVYEVRAKMKELKLTEQPAKPRVVL